jgi:hypothetical protein
MLLKEAATSASAEGILSVVMFCLFRLEICPAVQRDSRLRSGIGDWCGDGGEWEEEREANGQIYRRKGCLPGRLSDPEVTPEIYNCLYFELEG